ncbi:hypothetical protein D9619_009513 [Psilocybe cf. subviscida]|uniref:BTB domain-containing protein n=1 Tax=Psilocybe cf. subviscida TaxID=2480587 RepID=A0A8H5BUN7_9AGAR|nr:hypothetical protein D9619_009513 [Psilocybe cf. subviscida]
MAEETQDGNVSTASLQQWRRDIHESLRYARMRFGDVVWDYQEGDQLKKIWGHKAMILARAPPESRSWFDIDGIVTGKVVLSAADKMAPLQDLFNLEGRGRSVQQSDYQSTPGRLSTSSRLRSAATTMESLCHELQYLYTGINTRIRLADDRQHPVHAPVLQSVYTLQTNMLNMWAKRIECDMSLTIAEQYSISGAQDLQSPHPVFPCHRFVLASRSTYFSAALMGWLAHKTAIPVGAQVALTLPTPPFSPMSVYFTLGFIYSGTLKFGKRVFDLDGAFSIYRAADHLGIPTLRTEVEAVILSEMLHTSQSPPSYNSADPNSAVDVTQGNIFTESRDVQNNALENHSRSRLLGLFGPGWCTEEFAALQQDSRRAILDSFYSSLTMDNVVDLLRLAKYGFDVVDQIKGPSWASTIHSVLSAALKYLDSFLAENPGALLYLCSGSPDKLRWIFESFERTVALSPIFAAKIYVALIAMIINEMHIDGTHSSAAEAETTASIVLAAMGKQFQLTEVVHSTYSERENTGGHTRTYLAVVTGDDEGNLDLIDTNLIHVIEASTINGNPRQYIRGTSLHIEVCDPHTLKCHSKTRHFELVKVKIFADLGGATSAPTHVLRTGPEVLQGSADLLSVQSHNDSASYNEYAASLAIF